MKQQKRDYTKPTMYGILAVVLVVVGFLYITFSEVQECTNQYNKTTAIYQAWILNDTSMTDSYGNAGSNVPTKNIQALLSSYNDDCAKHKKMIFVVPESPFENYGSFMDDAP
jgi:hypothetical protein